MIKLQIPIVPGDTAYFIMHNKIHEATIKTVETTTKLNTYNALYTSYNYEVISNPAGTAYMTRGFSSNQIFKTKEELLATL